MGRVKINDLPANVKISREEMSKALGGAYHFANPFYQRLYSPYVQTQPAQNFQRPGILVDAIPINIP